MQVNHCATTQWQKYWLQKDRFQVKFKNETEFTQAFILTSGRQAII